MARPIGKLTSAILNRPAHSIQQPREHTTFYYSPALSYILTQTRGLVPHVPDQHMSLPWLCCAGALRPPPEPLPLDFDPPMHDQKERNSLSYCLVAGLIMWFIPCCPNTCTGDVDASLTSAGGQQLLTRACQRHDGNFS
eukprot:COSAG02_NODE_6773_length_3368_cov_2.474151_2_plen_139_part_00